jgi:hypothetical protein
MKSVIRKILQYGELLHSNHPIWKSSLLLIITLAGGVCGLGIYDSFYTKENGVRKKIIPGKQLQTHHDQFL